MNKMKKGFALVGRKGFTLIELLVVIAIIGILAALIITSLTGAQKRAKDVQIKNNVRSLSTALEQYATDNSAAYPAETTQVTVSGLAADATVCPTSTTGLCAYVTGGSGSQIFAGYTAGVTGSGYKTATTVSYIAAALLGNATESSTAGTAVTAGNGEYMSTGTGTLVGSSTLASLAISTRYWVIYGPQ